MSDWRDNRLSDEELTALFDRLFPAGFAGADVRAELAPDGWEHAPLVACFHPTVERVFEESVSFHRHLAELRIALSRRDRSVTAPESSSVEPTFEDVLRDYSPHPVKQDEELTDLVGRCLWDVFSDNHDVIVADGRLADIGSFRGASAFLDEYLCGDADEDRGRGDYLRFYMGTAFVAGRADLTPVYTMIFRRLHNCSADWVYHFPELHVIDLGAMDDECGQPGPGSASEKTSADVRRLRADVADSNSEAREDAMNRLPPETVTAYRLVYGRDPRGWPPV